MRLISSATVKRRRKRKGRRRKRREGHKHLGWGLVAVTFHMQHSGGAGGHAGDRGGLVSIRIGRHARRRGEEGEDSNQDSFCDTSAAAIWSQKIRHDYREGSGRSEREVRPQPSQSAAVWRRVHKAARGSWVRRAAAERSEGIPGGDSDQMYRVHTRCFRRQQGSDSDW